MTKTNVSDCHVCITICCVYFNNKCDSRWNMPLPRLVLQIGHNDNTINGLNPTAYSAAVLIILRMEVDVLKQLWCDETHSIEYNN